MRTFFFLLFSNVFVSGFTQSIHFPDHLRHTSIAAIKGYDSLIYYQCHVEEATQMLVTKSGEQISGKPQKYTITEKFVVTYNNGQYRLKYFTSSLSDYPNKKFAYLKLVEKPYWNFKQVKDTVLSEHDVLMFAAIEHKSHDSIEYDFTINKLNTNEIIIMGAKVMSQLVVEGNHLLKKNLEILK
jgi:hypothetical protein